MEFDPQSISQVIQIAGQAFNTSERGVALVRTVQGLFEKSEAAGDPDLKVAIADLATQVGDAALANAKLKLEIAELQKAALKLENFQSQKDRYELYETERHHFVLRLKETEQDGEPMHCICPQCFEDGKKSILQDYKHTLDCKRCEAVYSHRPMRR